MGEERHVLAWTHHHLLLDGWSVPIFMNEVVAHYQSLVGGGPLPPPAPPFRDYIAWLQRQDMEAARSFWTATLTGVAPHEMAGAVQKLRSAGASGVAVTERGTAFGYDYSSLAHKKRNKRMEPFIFTFPAEIDMNTFFEHDGEEFVFMLRCKAQFETKRQDKIEKWTLDTGDSLYFDSRIPHRGRSLSGDSQALVVLFQPE